METIDSEQVARVWSRVRGEEAQEILTLEELLARQWEDAALYLQLHHRTGDGRFQKLHQQKQAHCACLRGICRLLTGEPPSVPKRPPIRESLDITLSRCYGRELESLCAFQQRSQDPSYGPVYARMAQQSQEHCRIILELLGSLGGK